jgi:hypothetical protein
MIIALTIAGFLGALLFSLFVWSSIGMLTLLLAPIAGSAIALIFAMMVRSRLWGWMFRKRSADGRLYDAKQQPIGPSKG